MAIEREPRTEAEWWAQDAARHNALGQQMRADGVVIPLSTPVPRLKDDGSIDAGPDVSEISHNDMDDD